MKKEEQTCWRRRWGAPPALSLMMLLLLLLPPVVSAAGKCVVCLIQPLHHTVGSWCEVLNSHWDSVGLPHFDPVHSHFSP